MSEQDTTPDLTITVEGDAETGTVTITHGGEEGTQARAAVLDADGVITAVVLVPGDWEDQDPATRYTPDGDVVILGSDEAPPVGARWGQDVWELPEPQPQPELVLTDADRLRRDVDAVLGLLLTAQSGGPAPDVDWRDVLTGMVTRGAAAEHELRGAHGWQLIDESQLDDLLAGVDPATS